MNQSEIKKHIINFLSNRSISTYESSKKYLIFLRNIEIEGYTTVESNCLWFTLCLYKFKTENNIPDLIWSAARKYIISVLSADADQKEVVDESARYFLNVFREWKKEDHDNFVKEVISYYIQVLHLKQTIEETRDENTIGEWIDSYNELIHKIRDCANRMGFLKNLDCAVEEINRVQKTVVENIMKRAYWDMLEEKIRQKDYTIAICQLVELKNLIKDIIPHRFHSDLDDKFDIEYIKTKLEAAPQSPPSEAASLGPSSVHSGAAGPLHSVHPKGGCSSVQSGLLLRSHLVNLCRWIINSIKEWDSESKKSFYDREIETWEKAIESIDFGDAGVVDVEWPKFLRFSLELCTLLALDTKTRISVWRSIIQEYKIKSSGEP